MRRGMQRCAARCRWAPWCWRRTAAFWRVAGNATEATHDASAHAELLAMRAAASGLGRTRLVGCDLWVTLEPCAMCAAAAVHFRMRRVVFGAYDPKGGGVEHGARVLSAPGCLHVPEVTGGVREGECGAVLRGFFAGLRK